VSPRARERAADVAERLSRAIPRPHVELRFENAWQLLVASILAAQSTDRTVNRVMPELLSRWPDPAALARAPQAEVEKVVLSTGFFRNKSKAIRAASAAIAEHFAGQVPRTMEEMLELPGVARKTANVVLGAAYGVASGIVVDTHVQRVAHRLRLTRQIAPEKIEAVLCGLFPPEEWIRISHRLVLHGRHVCTARAPRCEECPLNEVCPSRQAPPRGTWSERAQAIAAEMESRAESFSRVDGVPAPQ
jgi:endonuclease-3